jgi:hypothetical protein
MDEQVTSTNEGESEQVTQLLKGLGFFKDWSNYLLVTTVAALGWVATKPVLVVSYPRLLEGTILFFGLSVIFAIFTLALIPLVSENCRRDTKSIYEVEVQCRPFWFRTSSFKLKWVCWFQHVFFLLGIISFSIGSIMGAEQGGAAGAVGRP